MADRAGGRARSEERPDVAVPVRVFRRAFAYYRAIHDVAIVDVQPSGVRRGV